jgi:hypothetical protein
MSPTQLFPEETMKSSELPAKRGAPMKLEAKFRKENKTDFYRQISSQK